MSGAGTSQQPRLATTDDLDAIVELRRAMFDDWAVADGVDPASVRTDWIAPARAHLERGLRGGTIHVALVDDAAGTPIASGLGEIQQRLATPALADGRLGYVGSMYTRPEHRGLGHGARIVELLLEQFRAAGIRTVELFAAPLAEPIYRRAGFRDRPGGAPLRIRLEPPA